MAFGNETVTLQRETAVPQVGNECMLLLRIDFALQMYRFDNVRVASRTEGPSIVMTTSTVVNAVPEWSIDTIAPVEAGTTPDQVHSFLIMQLPFITPLNRRSRAVHSRPSARWRLSWPTLLWRSAPHATASS